VLAGDFHQIGNFMECISRHIDVMALAFLRRLRDTPDSAATAEAAPDHDAVIRALSRSPIVVEALEADRDAELAARTALVEQIAEIEAATTRRVAELSTEAAAARAVALELHWKWAAAERAHAALSGELFGDMHRAEAAVRRLQHQLEATAPPVVTELKHELEDVIERTMRERPQSGGAPSHVPSIVETGTVGPRPAGAKSGGSDMPAPTPARGRPSRVPPAPPTDWYSMQEQRLAALRGLREPARACAHAADPIAAVGAVRAEMVRLSKVES
jgi:hypothetical protein